jgi:hypothetical protein
MYTAMFRKHLYKQLFSFKETVDAVDAAALDSDNG